MRTTDYCTLRTANQHRGLAIKSKRSYLVLMKFFTIFLFLAASILQGCSTSQTWYKPGGTQREFDIDSKECEIIARQQALLRSESGKRYNPVDYAELYQHCIAARGWGTKPLANDATDLANPVTTQTSPLGRLEKNTLTAFDRQIVLPAGSEEPVKLVFQ